MASFPYAERARAAEAARHAVGAAYQRWRRERSAVAEQSWQDSIRWFGTCLLHAYPPAFRDGLDDLRAGDHAFVDTALAFLEADPLFFRSGYAKERILRYLGRIVMEPPQMQRLQGILLAALARPVRREFRRYCNVARRVADAAFVARVQALATASDAATARRARWMLTAIGEAAPGLTRSRGLPA